MKPERRRCVGPDRPCDRFKGRVQGFQTGDGRVPEHERRKKSPKRQTGDRDLALEGFPNRGAHVSPRAGC